MSNGLLRSGGWRVWRMVLGCLGSAAVLLASSQSRADDIDFSRDIRPILSDKCFFCHGPDAKHREADLRLDVRESALELVKPGQSAESELIRRIRSDDPDEMMPPPKSHRTLTAEQKVLIVKWVDGGAPGESTGPFARWSNRRCLRPPIRR